MTTIIGNNKYKYDEYVFVKELNILIDTELVIYGIFRDLFMGKAIPYDIYHLIQTFCGDVFCPGTNKSN